MKVLVIGSGGREHALAWKLAQEAEVYAAPGNPGIAEVAQCFPISAAEHGEIGDLCKELSPDLVVVGPEDPLIAGLGDLLRSAGLAVFGPGRDGASLEASKADSKELMAQSGVPTARFASFRDPDEAKAFARELFATGNGAVVKASGVALGKGVIVCGSISEAEDAIGAMLIERVFGSAGKTIVVEERLTGKEFSLLTVCSGSDSFSLPIAQDYKRILDGDRGPNTGGMGSYSPVEWLSDKAISDAKNNIAKPTLARLSENGVDFRGVLFSGVMVQNDKPYCLEYNVRFGDPEIQSLVMRIGPGFADLLHAAALGETLPYLEILKNAAVTVVLASGGYPGSYEKGKPITLPSELPEKVQIFHAGTAIMDSRLVTAGGRVLCVTASGSDVAEARELAYSVVRQVEFEGMQYRKDIGI